MKPLNRLTVSTITKGLIFGGALVLGACDKKEEETATACPATTVPAVAALLEGTEQLDANGCPIVVVPVSAAQPETASSTATVDPVVAAADPAPAAPASPAVVVDQPPPALTAFSAVADGYLGTLSYSLTYPTDASDIVKVIVRAKAGASAPANCTDGEPVIYILSGFSVSISFSSWAPPGIAYSYIACTIDTKDQETASTASTNVTTATKHRFFTSSASFAANLNATYNSRLFATGVEGADERCQYLAEQASLSGEWRAVISSVAGAASTRIRVFGNVYNTKPAPQKMADDRDELFGGAGIQAAPAYSESGAAVTGAAWTNSTIAGAQDAMDYSCGSWSYTSGNTYTGTVTAIDDAFLNDSVTACSSTAHLYCIEQLPEAMYPSVLNLDVTPGASGEFTIEMIFPSSVGGVDHIALRRGTGIAGATPDCTTGALVKTFATSDITALGIGTFADTGVGTGPVSYRACVYDAAGNILSSTMTPVPTAGLQHIFASSHRWDGKLTAAFSDDHQTAYATGLEGADARCTALADGAGLGSMTWKAFMSDQTTDAKDRLTVTKVYDTGGTKIADDATDLWDNSIDAQILNSEFGTSVPQANDIWTGSTAAGLKISSSADTCVGWTVNTSGNGRVGWDESVSSSWFSGGVDACSSKQMLYCISE